MRHADTQWVPADVWEAYAAMINNDHLGMVANRSPAQKRAEREHNKGEQKVCGGCRWLNDEAGLTVGGFCTAPVPMWASGTYEMLPDDNAEDCQTYEAEP